MKEKLTIGLTPAMFWVSYILLFMIGGLFTFFGLPIRPFVVVFVSFPVLFFVKTIKLDNIFKLHVLLFLITIVSGVANGSPIIKILYFNKFIIISYTIYFLCSKYINKGNIKKIIDISIVLGLLQLPVVIVQRLFYDEIMKFKVTSETIDYLDIAFGTFYIKNDPQLNVFLVGLIILLLYEKNYRIKLKGAIIGIYVLIIMISGSKIMQLGILGILGIYFLSNVSIKRIVVGGMLAVVFFIGFAQTARYNVLKEELRYALMEASLQNTNTRDFERGGYSRSAAILHYYNQPLKWIGDGPSKYFDVSTGKNIIGNTGQIFKFYSEIGVAGLLISYLILFIISRKSENRMRGYLFFFAICMMTITSNIFSDAGILLAYNIFSQKLEFA